MALRSMGLTTRSTRPTRRRDTCGLTRRGSQPCTAMWRVDPMNEIEPANSGSFSVYQFLIDGTQEQVRSFVSAEEAVKAAHHYTHNVAAMAGITLRVIITDGLDCTVFEWRKGEGVVFPT